MGAGRVKGDILLFSCLTQVDGCMPRTARASVSDFCYHVINRGNGSAGWVSRMAAQLDRSAVETVEYRSRYRQM